MKVLHVAETIKGGVATVMAQLIVNGIKEQQQISVIIPSDQISELYGVDEKYIRKFHRKKRGIFECFFLGIKFLQELFNFKPDVVHIHSSLAGLVCRVILILISPIFRPKVIYCPHAFSFLRSTGFLRLKICVIIEKFLLCVTDHIICVSKFEYEQAINFGFNSKKLEVIYNGIPIIKHCVFPESDLNTHINCLFVGRFDYQKGFDILLNIISACHLVNVKFLIVGDYVNDSKVEDLDKYPNASFLGWLNHDELENIYKIADLLLIPSRWEGFAMVPLEAMNHSIPILASNASSLPEVVLNNQTGFLFSIDDVSYVIDLLGKVTVKEWKSMGMKGKSYLEKNFSSELMVARTYRLY